MVVLTSVFLFNILCAIVPCDPDYGKPQIDESVAASNQVVFRNSFGKEIGEEVEPKVKLENYGLIEGYTMSTIGGRKIYAFEGIPYAEAPVNERRFQV